MKICFLLMSCNIDFFIKEEQVVKDTWLSSIINKVYPDVEYYFYTSGETEFIDEENHKIYVDTPDKWDTTFFKTKRALELLKDKNYDYIVRTNLSTYVNVQLVYNIIKGLLETNHIQDVCGNELCVHNNVLYACGKFLIFNKNHINLILESDKQYESQLDADDYIFGCIFKDKYNYHIFEDYCFTNRPYGAFNHTELSNDIKEHVAITYRVFDFENYTETKYLHREIEEFQLAKVIHNNMISNVITESDIITCLKYKNQHCFISGVGEILIK